MCVMLVSLLLLDMGSMVRNKLQLNIYLLRFIVTWQCDHYPTKQWKAACFFWYSSIIKQ